MTIHDIPFVHYDRFSKRKVYHMQINDVIDLSAAPWYSTTCLVKGVASGSDTQAEVGSPILRDEWTDIYA